MKYVSDFKEFLNEIKFTMPKKGDDNLIKKIRDKQKKMGIRKKTPNYYPALAKFVSTLNYVKILEVVLENDKLFNNADFANYYINEAKGDIKKLKEMFKTIEPSVEALKILHGSSKKAHAILKGDQKKNDSIDSLIEAVIKFTKDNVVTDEEATYIVGILQDKKNAIAIDYQVLLQAAKKKNATKGLSLLSKSIRKTYGPLYMSSENAKDDGLEHLRIKLNLMFNAGLSNNAKLGGGLKSSGWKGYVEFKKDGKIVTIGSSDSVVGETSGTAEVGVNIIFKSLLDNGYVTEDDIIKFSYESKPDTLYYTVEDGKITKVKRKDLNGKDVLDDKNRPMRKTASAYTASRCIENVLQFGSNKGLIKDIKFIPAVPKPKR